MLFFLLAVSLAIGTLWVLNNALSGLRTGPARTKHDYDAIVVGGSIAGPFVAKALSDQGRKVLLVERSLFTKPDRIIGELLQPGGLGALKELGMEQCALSIGMPCKGYLVVDPKGKQVDLPYRSGFSGVSFHFGNFVQNLRAFVFENCKENVTMVEGTVTQILTEKSSFLERAYGIQYTTLRDYKVPDNTFRVDPPKADAGAATVTKTATAPLVIMCDGGMSKWKGRFQHYTPAAQFHSNFVGLILKGVQLPVEQRGTVFFGRTGPILSYRLDDNELRFLVDYNKPNLPSLSEQSEWLVSEVAPYLPPNLRPEFIRVASDTANIRSMPVARYPPTFPLIRGYVGIGDHNNQRHPLTGGGMTCAFRDALRLSKNLKAVGPMRSDLPNEMAKIEERLHKAVVSYARNRYAHSCCINLLSWALYAVFSIPVLRDACFDYFLRGGDCVQGPMDLLAGLDPSVTTLFLHYYGVMLHGVYRIMTRTGPYSSRRYDDDEEGDRHELTGAERVWNMVAFFADPSRMSKAIYVLVKATMVALPIAKNEFFSVWRVIDPTSALALISKRAKMFVYNRLMNGKQRKPVGL